jgi:hypothetical protein
MWFGWLLGCVLVQEMFYLVKVFVERGWMGLVGTYWGKGSRFEDGLTLVFNVR